MKRVTGYPVWNIRDFGALPDDRTLATLAIRDAIRSAAAAGGGVVYVPAGQYLTGTVQLLDDVTLHLEAGAVLRGSEDLADYSPNFLVYAEDARNITLSGAGVIDGSGTSFFPRDAQGRWYKPPDEAGIWRPDRLVRLVRCENVLIEGVTLRNSPSWTVHPIDCHDLQIRGITILNGIYAEDGINTDGIDPDGCSRVRISDCFLQTGDDAIALKVQESESDTCRDITITNCVIHSSQHGLKIGAGTRGAFRNVVISNCVIRDASSGIGLWMRDGGSIDGFTATNVSMTLSTRETVTEVGENPEVLEGGQPIYVWIGREREGDPYGTIRNVLITKVTAVADGAVFISGVEEQHVEGITLDDVHIVMKGGKEKKYSREPGYPRLLNERGDPVLWAPRHSPYDVFCRHVSGLKLRNLKLEWGDPEKAEWGSAIRCWHAREVEIEGFAGRHALGSDRASIHLRDVDGALIRGCRAAGHTDTFLGLERGSRDIVLIDNDLRQATRVAALGEGTDPESLFETSNRPPNGEPA